MKLRPMSDCIIVKQHEEETVTASGIVLAFAKTEKKFQGDIVRAGPGKIMDNGQLRPMALKEGEVVLFGEYSGQKFKYEDQEYLMMREPDVIGVVEP